MEKIYMMWFSHDVICWVSWELNLQIYEVLCSSLLNHLCMHHMWCIQLAQTVPTYLTSNWYSTARQTFHERSERGSFFITTLLKSTQIFSFVPAAVLKSTQTQKIYVFIGGTIVQKLHYILKKKVWNYFHLCETYVS